jgi:hypothetical protein
MFLTGSVCSSRPSSRVLRDSTYAVKVNCVLLSKILYGTDKRGLRPERARGYFFSKSPRLFLGPTQSRNGLLPGGKTLMQRVELSLITFKRFRSLFTVCATERELTPLLDTSYKLEPRTVYTALLNILSVGVPLSLRSEILVSLFSGDLICILNYVLPWSVTTTM